MQHEASQGSANDARQAILDAAREEIRTAGVLGLRIADVASRAHYSASAIYRYFEDRNGLLAAVLGDLYDEILERRSAAIAERIPPEGPISIDDVVHLAAAPSELTTGDEYRIRLQILAVASTNPALERRISEIAQRRYQEMTAALRAIQRRLPAGEHFDERVFTIMVVNTLLYYNVLLGEFGVDDEAYFAFVKHVATARAT